MRPQPLIAVSDVEASSRWYQQLLGCSSDHGGSAYERLVSNGNLILQLHSFEVELGLKSPETTPISATTKDLGPASAENAKTADKLTS